MLNQRFSKRNLLVILAVMLGAQSCIDQEDFEFDKLTGVRANPSVAFPLLYGSLSIEDILPSEESENIHTDGDNLVHLLYTDTLKSASILDHFLLPARKINEVYPVVDGALLPSGQKVVVEKRKMLDFEFPDADFDQVHLKDGKVAVEAGSSLATDVQLNISFPTLTKEGKPLLMKLSLPKGSNRNKVSQVAILNGYTADFSGYGRGENYLPIDVKATTDGQTGGPAPALEQLSLELEIGGLKYRLLTGDLGQVETELPASEIALPTFEKVFSKGKFGLKNPMLSFDILNSNGVPLRVSTQVLQARNNKGESLDIEINPSSPIDILYPTEYGATAQTSLSIQNVAELIELAPSVVDYKLSGRLNMIPTSNQNFLTDSSRLDVIFNADIPLWGYMEGVPVSDTLLMPLEINDAQVKEASLRVLIENGFPLNAQVQILFTDQYYNVLETLFTGEYETLLPAASVNAEGEVVSAGKYDKDIEVSSERFERILKAEKMIVKAILQTTRLENGSFPHVKIKSDYKLNVNLGAKTTTKLTVKF